MAHDYGAAIDSGNCKREVVPVTYPELPDAVTTNDLHRLVSPIDDEAQKLDA
jgi:hypothetical protein